MKIFTYAIFILPSFYFAQNHVTSSGSSSSNSNGSISVSVGQVSYVSNQNNHGSISGGNQQAFEIYSVSIDKLQEFKLEVFPNPTSDFLILKHDPQSNEKLSYQLTDAQGKIICQANFETSESKINVKDFASGTYLLQVINLNQGSNSYKIIKK